MIDKSVFPEKTLLNLTFSNRRPFISFNFSKGTVKSFMSRPPPLICQALEKLDKSGITLPARASFILSLRDLFQKRSKRFPRLSRADCRTWIDVLELVCEQLNQEQSPVKKGSNLDMSAEDEIQELIDEHMNSPKKPFEERVQEFLKQEEQAEYEYEEEEEESEDEIVQPVRRSPPKNQDEIIVGKFLTIPSSESSDDEAKKKTQKKKAQTSPLRMSQPLSQQLQSSPKYINLDALSDAKRDDKNTKPQKPKERRRAPSPKESPSFMRMYPDNPSDSSEQDVDPETGLLTVKMTKEDYEIVRHLKARKMGKGELPGFIGFSHPPDEEDSERERKHRRKHRKHKHKKHHHETYKRKLVKKMGTPVRLMLRSPSPTKNTTGIFLSLPEEQTEVRASPGKSPIKSTSPGSKQRTPVSASKRTTPKRSPLLKTKAEGDDLSDDFVIDELIDG